MNDETKISLQFNNTVNNQKKIDEYVKQLEKIYALTDGLKGNKDVLDKVNTNLVETNKQTKNIGKNANSLEKTFKTAFNVAKITAFYQGLTKVWNSMTKFTKASSEYIENVNLLEVAYKNANETIEESSARIESFIDKMAELYGLDESSLTRQFGIFKQMANAMQLPTETAEHLSELMVKMTNDVASLYNLDLNRASNALQSALAGQVRPIRSATGADITEKTLQNTVDALELDRSISQLSYVEKRLVMVISLTNQLKQSQGDYARTIESTANQFRILGEQWSRLTRSVGNVFYNLLGSILPYLNGILMALTEIFNLIASLLGFEMPEFDYSGLSGVSEAALDIEEGLDGAGDSADSLKQKLSGLRGFDKLNVISTPKSSGGSGSAGGAGGTIDPKILNAFTDAFGEYDDLMGSVRMKALDIRDAIMEWLGFTKEINPITGEVEWKYEGIGKTFSNIWESIKKLSPEMQLVVAGLTAMVGAKIIGGIGSLISGFEKLTGWTNSAGETLKGFSKTNIDYWQQNATMAQKFTTALIGAGGVVAGLTMVSDAMDKISKDGLTLGNSMEVLGGGLSSIAGGAMVGASIGGGTGALIGGVAGGISALITALANYKNEAQIISEEIINETKEINDAVSELNKEFDNIEEKYKQKFLTLGTHSALVDELEKIVDANGKIQAGYESRANYITTVLKQAYGIELEIIDGTIQKYGEQIEKIKEIIQKKKEEYAYEKIMERYTLALDEQTEAYSNLEQAASAFKRAQKEEEKYLAKWQKKWDENTGSIREQFSSYEEYMEAVRDTADYKDLRKALYSTGEAFANAEQSYQKTQRAVMEYQGAVDAMVQDNQEAIDYYVNKELLAHGQEIKSYTQLTNEAKWSYKERIRIATDEGKEINETIINSANERYREVASILATEVKQVKDITPDYVKAWSDVASQSSSIFLQYINKLPEDVRKNVLNKMLQDTNNITPEMVEQFKELAKNDTKGFLSIIEQLPTDVSKSLINKMYPAGQGISKELQNGLDSISPTITVGLDTSEVENKVWDIDSLVWNMGTSIKNALSGIGGFFKADGGIFYNGGWHNIAGYADGGLPPVGQMFVARENGAELVGNINNHTAVMNNDQIVDSVADGVYRAVVNANATTQQSKTSVMIPIQIGTKEIGRVVINDLQKMAKTNGKPIVIGG